MFINMIPVPGLDAAKQIGGYAQQFQKSGLFKNTCAFLGKPVQGADWLKKHEASNSKESKGFLYYLQRYGSTFGNVFGVGGIVVSILLGKLPQSEEGNGFIKSLPGILRLAGLATIAGSAYSNITGLTTDKYVGEDERIAKMGVELLNRVQTFPENQGITNEYKNSPLRFIQKVRDAINGCDCGSSSGVKKFFTGPPGTGKTKGMDFLTARIIEHEENKTSDKREVVVLRLQGSALKEAISDKNSSSSAWAEGFNQLLSLSGINPENTGDVTSFLNQTKTKLLQGVLLGLNNKFQEYEKEGKRLVVQIDEIDELWSVAKDKDGRYDEEFINNISGTLGNLFDERNNYDILCTSNLTVLDLVGFYSNYQGDSTKLKASNMAKVYDRLDKMCTQIDPPDIDTKGRIFHVYQKQFITSEMLSDDKYEGLSLRELMAMDEDTAKDKLVELFQKRFDLKKFQLFDPQPTAQNRVLRALVGSARSMHEFDNIREGILFRMKLECLTGRDIKTLLEKEITDPYRARGEKISLQDFLDKLERKVKGVEIDSHYVQELDKFLNPYKNVINEEEIKQLRLDIEKGRNANGLVNAQNNRQRLLDGAPKVKSLFDKLEALTDEDDTKIFTNSASKPESRFVDRLHKFIADYLSENSTFLRTADEATIDSSLFSINREAASLLGELNGLLAT